MFSDREGGYELRGRWNFKQPIVRTTLKSMSVSVHGVKLWNKLPDNIKESKNIVQFKKEFKNKTLDKYRHDGI